MKISTTMKTVTGIAIGIGVATGINTIVSSIIAGITLKDHFDRKCKTECDVHIEKSDNNSETNDNPVEIVNYLNEEEVVCFANESYIMRNTEKYEKVKNSLALFLAANPYYCQSKELNQERLALLETVHNNIIDDHHVYDTLNSILKGVVWNSENNNTELEKFFDYLEKMVEFFKFRDEIMHK